MHIFTILLGAGLIIFGVATVPLRKKCPDKFWKLKPMKKMWGEKLGMIIHIAGYTIIPIIVGLIFLIAGMSGISVF